MKMTWLPLGCLLTCSVWGHAQSLTSESQKIPITQEKVDILPQPDFGASVYSTYDKGVYVEYITVGGTANISGFLAYDKLLTIDEHEINSKADLTLVLEQYDIGDQVTAQVMRNGERLYLDVTLRPKPEGKLYYHHYNEYRAGLIKAGPCAMVEQMENRAMIGVRVESYGLYVHEFVEGTNAENAGIQKADRLEYLNAYGVHDYYSLTKELERYVPGEQVAIGMIRGEEHLTTDVRLSSWAVLQPEVYTIYKEVCVEQQNAELLVAKDLDNIEELIVQLDVTEEVSATETAPQEPTPQTDEAEGGEPRAMTLDIAANLSLDIFPNPAREQVQLSFEGKEAPFIVSIVSVDGKVVYQEMINESTGFYQTTLEVSMYPAGMYIVNINQGDTQISKQLILTD